MHPLLHFPLLTGSPAYIHTNQHQKLQKPKEDELFITLPFNLLKQLLVMNCPPLPDLQWAKSGGSTMTARPDLQYLVRAASQHARLLCPEQDPLRCTQGIKRGCNTSSLAGIQHNIEQVRARFWSLNACQGPLTRWNLFQYCLQEFPELMGSQCHYKHTGQTHKPSWWFFISSHLSCTWIYYDLFFPSSGGARSGHLHHRDHPPTDTVPREKNWDKPT